MNSKVSKTIIASVLVLAGLALILAFVAACVPFNQANPTPITIQVAGSRPAPILGLILDLDYKVVGMVANGAAEKAAVQVGDTIKHVNGQEITRGNSSLRIFRRLDRSKKVTLGLVRGQEEIDVELTPLPPPAFLGAPTGTPMPPELLYF